jgi:hypothetical protein
MARSMFGNWKGKEYPVCLPHEDNGTVSAVFPQFPTGMGSGETEQEALEDAAFHLAHGVFFTIKGGGQVPEPIDEGEAEDLFEQCEQSKVPYRSKVWVVVKVQPELVDEGL